MKCVRQQPRKWMKEGWTLVESIPSLHFSGCAAGRSERIRDPPTHHKQSTNSPTELPTPLPRWCHAAFPPTLASPEPSTSTLQCCMIIPGPVQMPVLASDGQVACRPPPLRATDEKKSAQHAAGVDLMATEALLALSRESACSMAWAGATHGASVRQRNSCDETESDSHGGQQPQQAGRTQNPSRTPSTTSSCRT